MQYRMSQVHMSQVGASSTGKVQKSGVALRLFIFLTRLLFFVRKRKLALNFEEKSDY